MAIQLPSYMGSFFGFNFQGPQSKKFGLGHSTNHLELPRFLLFWYEVLVHGKDGANTVLNRFKSQIGGTSDLSYDFLNGLDSF
jgi:hypothetical protein